LFVSLSLIRAGAVARGKRLMLLEKHTDCINFTARMAAVLTILLQSDADVICLQEVTHWSKELLTQNDTRLSTQYDVSTNALGRYGILMLTKKDLLPEYRTVEMPTMMGRDLLAVRIHLGNHQKAAIFSAHFESLASSSLRKEQILCAKTSMLSVPGLAKGKNTILCGDFNFCSYRNFNRDDVDQLENDVLEEVLPEYNDVWSSVVWPKSSSSTSSSSNVSIFF